MNILRKLLLILSFIIISCTQIINDVNNDNSNDNSNDDSDDVPVIEITCGMEVYEDITFTEDLICPPEEHSPLRILGSNLTVDL